MASLGMVLHIKGHPLPEDGASQYAFVAGLAILIPALTAAGAVIRFASRGWRVAFMFNAAAALMAVGTALAAALQGSVASATFLALAALLSSSEALLHAKTLQLNMEMVGHWQSPEGERVWSLRGAQLARVVGGGNDGVGGLEGHWAGQPTSGNGSTSD
jgi:hypothetical protein